MASTRFRPLSSTVRRVEAAQRADLGEHLQHRGERPQAAELAELIAQVLQGELLADDALGQALGLLGVEAALGLLDERQDVAHADHARGHALGMEELEVVRLLAHAHEADGHPGHGADRERRAAARVAVQLGEDGAGERQDRRRTARRSSPRPGRSSSRPRTASRCGWMRSASWRDLLHQRRVHVQAAGGVHDHHVVAALAGHRRAPGRRGRPPSRPARARAPAPRPPCPPA